MNWSTIPSQDVKLGDPDKFAGKDRLRVLESNKPYLERHEERLVAIHGEAVHRTDFLNEKMNSLISAFK